jgi:hypothetical protein
MNRRPNVILILILLLSVVLCGCADFRGHQLPPISQWPPKSVEKGKSISILVDSKLEKDFVPVAREQAIRAYKESGLFSEVKTRLSEIDPSDTELKAEIDFYWETKSVITLPVDFFLDFLSIVTIFISPFPEGHKITMVTTIKDKKGNILGKYEKSENYYVIMEALLIIPEIVLPQSTVWKDLWYDLNRSVINEIHAQGIA